MTLTITRPKRRGFTMLPMMDEMDKMIGRMFRDGYDNWDSSTGWMPPVDIIEDKNGIVVKAEAPGLEKDNFKIAVEDNVLTISGEKKVEFEEGDKEHSLHRTERVYGQFSRSFTLPRGVDTSKVKAKYRNGVLEVTLPKSEESKPKEISVDVS
jgi:HSP20 family protein